MGTLEKLSLPIALGGFEKLPVCCLMPAPKIFG